MQLAKASSLVMSSWEHWCRLFWHLLLSKLLLGLEPHDCSLVFNESDARFSWSHALPQPDSSAAQISSPHPSAVFIGAVYRSPAFLRSRARRGPAPGESRGAVSRARAAGRA